MNKHEIQVNGLTYQCDSIWYNYDQTDSEQSTRTDENILIRDVLPEMVKIGVRFEHPTETEVSRILKMRKLEECSVTYWCIRDQQYVTKHMYPVSDDIKVMSSIDGSFIVEPFEIRFIQMR